MHAQFFHRGFFEDQALQAKGLGQLLGFIGQIGGGADIARQIAQVTRQVHPVDDGGTLGNGVQRGFVRFFSQQQCDRLKFDRCGFRRCLEGIEAVSTLAREHDALADRCDCRQIVQGDASQAIDRICSIGAQHSLNARPVSLGPALVRQLIGIAEADEN